MYVRIHMYIVTQNTFSVPLPFVRWPRSAIPIRISNFHFPANSHSKFRFQLAYILPVSISQCNFIAYARLCLEPSSAGLSMLSYISWPLVSFQAFHVLVYIYGLSLLLREIIIRVTFARTEKSPCDLVRDANGRCGTTVVGDQPGQALPRPPCLPRKPDSLMGRLSISTFRL